MSCYCTASPFTTDHDTTDHDTTDHDTTDHDTTEETATGRHTRSTATDAWRRERKAEGGRRSRTIDLS